VGWGGGGWSGFVGAVAAAALAAVGPVGEELGGEHTEAGGGVEIDRAARRERLAVAAEDLVATGVAGSETARMGVEMVGSEAPGHHRSVPRNVVSRNIANPCAPCSDRTPLGGYGDPAAVTAVTPQCC
jgi:hypothetical protein